MLETWIRDLTTTTSLVVEAVAALIVAFAVAEAVVRLVITMPRHTGDAAPQAAHDAKEDIRLRLGRWLALALAAIRTALNFFLQREIDAAQARRETASGGDGSGSPVDQAAPPAR